MAITRCPYCHAIIDENDKYCNNCGTQLLFPEDEEVEEEIPGEKIVDAETEEKDYTVDEPKGDKKPSDVIDLAEEFDEELEEVTEEMALDRLVEETVGEEAADDATEEVILVDEIEAVEGSAKTKVGEELKGREETLATAMARPEKPEETREIKEQEREKEEEPVIEFISGGEDEGTAATAGEAALRPDTFDTKELEGIGQTAELVKDKIDKFLEVMAEKKAEQAQSPEEPRDSTGTLPPWASTMKGAPAFREDTGKAEPAQARGGRTPTPATTEEVEIFPRRRSSDSTIGLPEKVSQVPLPFEREVAGESAPEEKIPEEPSPKERVPEKKPLQEEAPREEEEPEEEEEEAEAGIQEEVILPAGRVRPSRETPPPIREPGRRGAEAAEEGEAPGPRPPFRVAIFLKSKAFDVLFVGVFWLVALWLAGNSIGMDLFEILGSMSVSMVLLYAVLILLYFFLFKFFLGETLGDRLFRPRE